MLQRTWSLIALLLAVGCQSAPDALQSQADWQGYVEAPEDGARTEVAELRLLVKELAVAGLGGLDTTNGMAVDASADLGVAAQLIELGDRLDQLGVMLSSSGGAQPIHAALRAAGPPSAQETGAIESLQAALISLEIEHAMHSENIANLGVPGHKRRHIMQGSMLDQPSGVSIPIVLGSRLDMQQGVLELTGEQLDLAILGPGFFEIQRPNGDLTYTRAGSFREDFNGRLVTAEGYLLSDQVALKSDGGVMGVSVSPDGQVFTLGGNNQQAQAGAIRVHRFAHPEALKSISHCHFVPTTHSGPATAYQPGTAGAGEVKQGYLERSNVHLSEEIVELRTTQRRAAAVKLALASHGIYSL